MEKINQGQKITVEHLDGYSWKNVLFLWSIFVFLILTNIYSDTEETDPFTRLLFSIFLVVLIFFNWYYSASPQKFHKKQHAIYFFKNYLLVENVENFNNSMENHELPYDEIKRIYSTKKGYITIELHDPSMHIFKIENIKNLKLDNQLINKTNEVTEYLNNCIESFEIQPIPEKKIYTIDDFDDDPYGDDSDEK